MGYLLLLAATVLALTMSGSANVGWADDHGTHNHGRTREDTGRLTELTLEELMDIEVISTSKTVEKLSEAAAAVFVISQEDIRRSGAVSIPEVLRMAPGVEVARIDSSKWAVSARGFSDRFANKLLVLIDGRSVYSPFFSGVFWDVQDTMLEDVERIEVIRGPGSALWGANAVNGVINIITKHAADTQGGLITAGGGTEERGFGAVRYGGKLADKAYYRVYGKYFDRDGFVDASGHGANDDWSAFRSGFRTDFEPSRRDAFTVHGDVYDGSAGQSTEVYSLSPPYSRVLDADTRTFGGNLATRWKHSFSDTSEMAVQSYYDRSERQEVLAREDRDTFDIDFQHSFGLGERQKLTWGLGYRVTHDEISDTYTLHFDRLSRVDNLVSAFLQDEIALFPDRLRLTLGSRFEHNDYTGFEAQPTARLLWTPNQHNSVWAAVSRAVRTPSRVESDGRGNTVVLSTGGQFADPPLTLVSLFGNSSLSSEELMAYELGYRVQAARGLFLDIALFYNDYDKIISDATGTPFIEVTSGVPHLVAPFIAANNAAGVSYGVELSADWRVLNWWRIQLAYSYLEMHLHSDTDNEFWEILAKDGTSPQHQVSFRSGLDLARNLQLDLWLRYVGRLQRINVDSYTTMDARLAWKPIKGLELALVGQNLFNPNHFEFGQSISFPTQVERGFYGKITWRF